MAHSVFMNNNPVSFSLPILTDADIIMTTLDSDLFPGLSSDIEVHSGFADAQAECVWTIIDLSKRLC